MIQGLFRGLGILFILAAVAPTDAWAEGGERSRSSIPSRAMPSDLFDEVTPGRLQSMSANELQRFLLQGNYRYVHDVSTGQRRGSDHRGNLGVNGQKPPFFILGCMDSRVPISHIFDLGFGDNFSGTVGGEAMTPSMAGSMTYAVEHGTKLLVVLGHTKCGAVTAAVDGGVPADPSLAALVGLMKVDHHGHTHAEQVNNSVHANVTHQIEQLLRMSPTVAQKVLSGEVKVSGMVYDVDDFNVKAEQPPKGGWKAWIDEHRTELELGWAEQKRQGEEARAKALALAKARENCGGVGEMGH